MSTSYMKGMSPERYAELMRTDTHLTEDERKAGWHFCLDWDGMLIHKTDIEMQCCTCNLGLYK